MSVAPAASGERLLQPGSDRAGGRAHLVVIDGATHIDLYDKDEYVTPAVAKLTEFFGKHLAG